MILVFLPGQKVMFFFLFKSVFIYKVDVPQNYGISSQIIFGQLGVWQSSNDN